MTSKATDDYEPWQIMLAEDLRGLVFWSLRDSKSKQSSILAGVAPNERSPGRRAAGRRSQEVEDMPPELRGVTARGTATIPSRFSRILEEGRPRLVGAIWELREPDNASIMAHYSPSPERRRDGANRLAIHIAKRFHTQGIKKQARQIAWLMLTDGAAVGIRAHLGINAVDWKNSYTRKVSQQIGHIIERHDIDSLLAWHDVWSDDDLAAESA